MALHPERQTFRSFSYLKKVHRGYPVVKRKPGLDR